MTDPERRLDDVALRRTLRRLAASAAPPWLHAEVARRMGERLALMRLQPVRVIEWSAFLGASGDVLSRAYPKAQRVAVEPTDALRDRTRNRDRPAWYSLRRLSTGRVEVVGDHDALLPAAAQLVWSNMTLHAVKNPPALLRRWQQLLAADGFVMFSCFGPDTLRELRSLYAEAGWPLPTVAFVDMHDLGDMMVAAGFADPVMDQETLTLTWSDADALLAELRSMGANLSPDRFQGLRTPAWHGRLRERLRQRAGPHGRLALSFEIAYGHAFKAPPRAEPQAPTTVSLAEMRSLVKTPRTRR